MPPDVTANSTTLDAALSYRERGWSVVPVPHGTKRPVLKQWEKLRLTNAEIRQHFGPDRMNVGVLLGDSSGNLIDVDLDHPKAVELAARYLPPTNAIFGHKGKPQSHWLYQATGPAKTRKFKSRTAGMIVEFRSTGTQTVFPPSVHPSGEPIEWSSDPIEPAQIDPNVLLAAVKNLAVAVREHLGESSGKPSRGSGREKRTSADAGASEQSGRSGSGASRIALEVRASRCLGAMLQMQMVDHQDGSCRLYACACRIIEHDLPDAVALSVLQKYVDQRPFPRTWSEAEILDRFRDAERNCVRGQAFVPDLDDDRLIRLGTRDPESGKVVLSPKKTVPTADAFVRQYFSHFEGTTLGYYAGMLMAWRNNRYAELEDVAIKRDLQQWLHSALRYAIDPRTKELGLIPFDSNPNTVNAAFETVRNSVFLSADTPVPCWLSRSSELPAGEFLACRSHLLHLPTMTRRPMTPSFFTTTALEFDHNQDAPKPEAWLRFLEQLFEGDEESSLLLQEWAGYLLTADTCQQKMMLLVGPKRSGKGTIGRVLRKLIGEGNVCGPTTSSLAGQFGLQPLIGKTLAVVSDARFAGENIMTVVERLLCISGEDSLTIDRKHIGSVTMKLPTRFMFLTNELPKFTDSSGALAGRLLILSLRKSFYGQEDHNLTERLLAELPGILNWALEGRARLRARGRFVQPASSSSAIEEIEDLSSPVGAFVREKCVRGPGYRVDVDELFQAWVTWCAAEGRQAASTKQMFGRNLTAATGLTRRRSTDQLAFYDGIAIRSW